jgi:ribosomal RNA-processing protein 12
MKRDERGNLKFNRNTKRSREEEDGLGPDLDEYLGEKGGKGKKKKQVGKLGDEFRAKVCWWST